MSNFGEFYSQYYELLYSEKDYKGEVEYVTELIREQNGASRTILDLGCGTGKHAEIFCQNGFAVHGVDMSTDMLKVAESKKPKGDKLLKFTHSDITELNLGEKFDAIISLFHVMSYQSTYLKLEKTLSVVSAHLDSGGIFIFDFWYGPAVMTDLPAPRIKRLENEKFSVTRIAEPIMNFQENIVEVQFDIHINEKSSGDTTQKRESHNMRYFFDSELEYFCSKYGLSVEGKHEWMTREKPTMDSWNVVWVVKKQEKS